ncbi:mitochondrial ATPase expression-domain-containing protein [Aspergillus crustosus]
MRVTGRPLGPHFHPRSVLYHPLSISPHQLRPIVAPPRRLARSLSTRTTRVVETNTRARKLTPARLRIAVNRERGRYQSSLHLGIGLGLDGNSLEDDPPEDLRKWAFDSRINTAQPDQVMAALLDPACSKLVGQMSQTAFIEALHLLSPEYFVVPWRKIYRPVHAHTVWYKKYKSLDTILDEFVNNICTIIQIRQAAGHFIGLAEYTHLLDCARSVGDGLMADYVWHSMQIDRTAPDLQCYNYYMEAKVWNGAYGNLESHRLRVTPWAYNRRRYGNPGWSGYGTAERSVRKAVLLIHTEMQENGYKEDEATIVNILLASARVGYRCGMGDVLKRTWNVDVEALKQGTPHTVIQYPRSSPLYPSGRLLIAIAHAYGTNNDIPSALRLIEHFHVSYDIPIPHEAWTELFEWSFVLSRLRRGETFDQKVLGYVHPAFFQALGRTMLEEPNNVRPNVEIHYKLAKGAKRRRQVSNLLHHMRRAYQLMTETRKRRMSARRMVESYLRHPRMIEGSGTGIRSPVLWSRGFAEAVHTYDILRHQGMQETILLERLVRVLIRGRRLLGNSTDAWDRLWIPRAIEEWREFLPQTLNYEISTGYVNFKAQTRLMEPIFIRHYEVQRRLCSLNEATMEEEDPPQLEDRDVWAEYRLSLEGADIDHPLVKRLYMPTNVEEPDPGLELDPELGRYHRTLLEGTGNNTYREVMGYGDYDDEENQLAWQDSEGDIPSDELELDEDQLTILDALEGRSSQPKPKYVTWIEGELGEEEDEDLYKKDFKRIDRDALSRTAAEIASRNGRNSALQSTFGQFVHTTDDGG